MLAWPFWDPHQICAVSGALSSPGATGIGYWQWRLWLPWVGEGSLRIAAFYKSVVYRKH